MQHGDFSVYNYRTSQLLSLDKGGIKIEEFTYAYDVKRLIVEKPKGPKLLMGDMTGKQHVEEVNEEADVEFKWGNKLEVYGQNPTIQLYESFVFDGIDYSLFDCVYIGTEPELSVGKLVKIWEELPNHNRMVEVVWFLRPEEIRDWIGDDKPLQNELLLASGVGEGLSNVNVLETICGKCNVVCTAKDRRNPQASEIELSMAEFIFSRTFDLGSYTILDNFPDTIAGIKVEYFFNSKDQGLLYPGIVPPNLNESMEKSTRPPNFQQPESVGKKFNFNSYGTKLSPIAEDEKEKTHFAGISSDRKTKLKYKDFSVTDVPDNRPTKRMNYLGLSKDQEMHSYGSPSLKLREKCSTKILQGKKFGPINRDLNTMSFSYHDRKISKGETTLRKASNFGNEKAPKLCEDNNVKTSRQFEVKRKPYNDQKITKGETVERKASKFGNEKVPKLRGDNNVMTSRHSIEVKRTSNEDRKISKGETTLWKASKFGNEKAPKLCEDNNIMTSRHFIEVKRKPYDDRKITKGETTERTASKFGNEKVPKLCEDNNVMTSRHFIEVKRKSNEDPKIFKGETTVRTASKFGNEKAPKPSEDNNIMTSRHFIEVKRKPYDDRKITKGETTERKASKFGNEKVPKLCEDNNVMTSRHFIEVKRKSNEDPKIFKGETTVRTASKFGNEKAPKPSEDNNIMTSRHFIEVKRKPYDEKRNWFIEQPWEEKVQRANERGTLVLLQNLDPSFSSSEVEDLVWESLGENVEAKMTQRNYFFSPHYGRALLIFKSRVAAEFAISELEKRCLMLEEGRIVVGRRVSLEKPDKKVAFVGHLTIPKAKIKQQCEEMRDAKSTSHCSQANTIEYEMAMEWRLLQDQSDKWWNLIHEKQAREIQKLKSKLTMLARKRWMNKCSSQQNQ